MDGNTGFMIIEVPLLVLAAGVIGTIAWNRNGNAVSMMSRASPITSRLVVAAGALALWTVLTATSIWLAFLYGFLVCHVLLFWVGRLAAGMGLILLGVFIVAVPFIWGWALWRPTVRH